MIAKIKLALVNNDFDEFSNLASELEEKISSGWLNTLNQDELVELRALYNQVLEALVILKHKDLERIKKLKQSLKYLN